MNDSDQPPKRRRTEDAYIQSPVESSADELAAGSDNDEAERRRTTWSIQKALPPKRPYARSRSFSGSASPDELAVDAAYWRSRPRDRGRSRSASRDMSVQGDDERESYEESYRSDEDERGGQDRDVSDRSPTPVPAPLPPKPEKLDYREKFLLRGHLRGVSAVRFSPDASMIASAGMFCRVYLRWWNG